MHHPSPDDDPTLAQRDRWMRAPSTDEAWPAGWEDLRALLAAQARCPSGDAHSRPTHAGLLPGDAHSRPKEGAR